MPENLLKIGIQSFCRFFCKFYGILQNGFMVEMWGSLFTCDWRRKHPIIDTSRTPQFMVPASYGILSNERKNVLSTIQDLTTPYISFSPEGFLDQKCRMLPQICCWFYWLWQRMLITAKYVQKFSYIPIKNKAIFKEKKIMPLKYVER